ncbi:protein VAPYRIN-LIKE-like isoform X2 [Magnolia sinica]|uniref:protein VAPYRIN-LIKE-like isoform X2 n=1 Tax=Magnolia sinica TaxID=86752 RepID=UPI002659DB52|nr:protein VAPYRIN-LIKE-like isoform X2 [Magnolia sinica]
MDRLITVDTKDLQLSFTPNKPSTSQTFTITNLMHTMSVAVSLSTTDSTLFSFKPPLPLTVLPPLSSLSYSLLSLSSPAASLSSHTLSIRSSMLPTGKAQPSDLRRLFSSPGRHIFKDASLPIAFVGPHVVDFLLRSPRTVPTDFLLSKAVSGCSGPQISALVRDAARVGNPDFVSTLIDAGGDVNCKGSDGASAISVAVASGHVGVVRVLVGNGVEFDTAVDRFWHDAAAANRVDLMEALLECCGIDSVDSSGRAAVHVAAGRGHVEALRFCVSAGGDPCRVDLNGWTPLHCASEEGRLEAVEFLLEHAPFTKYAVTKDGKTPFSLAVDGGHFHLLDVLRLDDVLQRAAGMDDVHGLKSCLSQGAKVNVRDQNGWTPLHRAAFKGRIESVKLLISHGAQVDLVDDAGYTPLHCAVEAGHAQVALYLITNGARVNPKSMKGRPGSLISPGVLMRLVHPMGT